MGNSESIAKKHYLQVNDQHFERALTKGHNEVAQNAAHQMRAGVAQTIIVQNAAQHEPLAMLGDALIFADVPKQKVARTGLEPVTYGL